MPMRQVEIAAKSVEEAVRLALEQLDRRRDEVDVEVISGSETGDDDDEVLVRVTARERLSGRARPQAAPAAPPPPSTRPAAAAAYAAPAPLPPLDELPADEEDEDEDEAGYVTVDIGEGGEESFASPADAVAPIATEILQKLLTQMRFRARIMRHDTAEEDYLNAENETPSLVLNIVGISEQDKSLLIGRRGETLAALQFMVNLLLGARTDLWARVVIDVDGYRLRRKEALTSLAARMAERVLAQRQPFPLEPMSAYDRRIVHMALAEHPQVMTESTGEGDQRRVVIMLREGRPVGEPAPRERR
jgi:spoIIIJ-associated protein